MALSRGWLRFGAVHKSPSGLPLRPAVSDVLGLPSRAMGYSSWENIAIRDLSAGAILFAWPLRVISDDERGLLASQVPGAVGMVTAGYPDDPHRLLQELLSGSPTLVEKAWETTVTTSLFVDSQWWSTRLMWEASTGKFICYYVDFRRPICRNGSRVDTLDLGLDLIAWANGTWTWKDEDHLPLVRSAGWILPDEEIQLELARQEVVKSVEESRFPFDGTLLDLVPDQGQGVPVLPLNWDQIE